ncbi:MAG: cytochrome b [Actinomycetota bacterium]
MKPQPYTPIAAALHWVHAGLFCALVVVGVTMVDLPKGAERSTAYALHKSLGLLALILVAVRLYWRLRCPPPPHPGLDARETALARITHRFLYLLLVLVPVSGFAAICFTPYPLAFFGLPLPKPGWPDAGLNSFFGLLHKGLLASLVLAILLHLAAALRHGWRRDGTLGRMFPRPGRT